MSGNKKQPGWTKGNLQKLIVSVKRSVPEEAKRKTYAKGRSPVDWDQAAVPPFSAEACRHKWEEILQEINKMRSLTELIVEAEEAIKAKHRPCEPKKPARAGYNAFFKEQMKLQREKFPHSNQRCTEVSKIWKELSSEERERYKEKVDDSEMIKYSMELWKWFKTLTPAEREDYLTRNPDKRKYLEIKKNKFYERKEPDLHRPSDSEDDDIEYSSSDEEAAIDWDCEEEEVEKEEGGDMFDMYW
ncbi:Nucleolar transcription factor 1-A [Collichthys lucidus]|uniref:Nucleolar transcription factor 1-A n=1 Tax=Collichthys lucidus TaxID=240159 RepID=A0A4U5VQU3_COLLU|nr:Nucleolar transcription factor 1-A [Collichthys lucidus]